uniref:Uncharacterized protein n=1 Tax=Panagrolaimus sp. PS1159 TaxID=55785 RepID=A0AC35GHZ9_9BILA
MMTLNMRLIPGIVIIFVQFFGAFFGSLLSRAMIRSSTFLDAFTNLGIVDLPNAYPPIEDPEHLQFSNRFQIYLMDSILTSFIVFVFLFTSTNSPTASVSTSTGLARAVTAYISLQTIGQANNFARLLANYVISAIFLSDNRVWRLFYLYIFGMITAPIIAAILY